MIYTVTLRLTTSENSDEHLRDAQAISNEITSWLEDLNADIESVAVNEEEQS